MKKKLCWQCKKDIEGCPEKWDIDNRIFFCSNKCANDYCQRFENGEISMKLEDLGVMTAEAQERGLE